MKAASGSVVLTSRQQPALARAAIERLLPQCAAAGIELVVARPDGVDDPPGLLDGARPVKRSPLATLPELRGAGLSVVSTDWVAVTEDNCLVAPDWLAAMQRALADSDADVIGGAIGNAQTDRAIDSAAFFAEYGFYGADSRERPLGVAPLIAVANVAYRNSVLPRVTEWSLAGRWEDAIHARLASEGARFHIAPAARVDQNLRFQVVSFLRERFQHGREYGRAASDGLNGAARLARAAVTPILPPILAARIWRSAGRSAPGEFVRGLPLMLVFLAGWAAGEATGYLEGPGK